MRDAVLHPARYSYRVFSVGDPTLTGTAARYHAPADHTPARKILKPAACALLALALGGCSLTRTAHLEGEPALVTSSVTRPVKGEGIESSDADLIKSVVAGAPNGREPIGALAWTNPDTGNRGTIMAIDRFVGNHGQNCKKFKTTVDSFVGISLYNGETCELQDDFWVLSWFTRDQG